MTSWLDRFAQKRESLDEQLTPPAWFRPFVEIEAIQGVSSVGDDLWSTPDGYYVHGRTTLVQPSGTVRTFPRAVVLIAFAACSVDAVQWHRHRLARKPSISPLTKPTFGILCYRYADWTTRFDHSESASYRGADGSYVDKAVVVDTLSVCFLSRADEASEIPYLFELRHALPRTA